MKLICKACEQEIKSVFVIVQRKDTGEYEIFHRMESPSVEYVTAIMVEEET